MRFQLTFYNEQIVTQLRLASFHKKSPFDAYQKNQDKMQQVLLSAKHYAKQNDLLLSYETLSQTRAALNQLEIRALQLIKHGHYSQAQTILFGKSFDQYLTHYIQATYQLVTANNLYHYWLELCNNLYIFQARQTDAIKLALLTKRPALLASYDDYHHRIAALFKEMEVNGEQVISMQDSAALAKAYAKLYYQDKKIIAYIQKQQYSKAELLMNSKTYALQQKTLENKIKRIHSNINNITIKELKRHNIDIALTVFQVIIILVLFLGIWLFVIRSIQYWQRKLTRANTDLTEINEELDLKVIQRTQNLQHAFEALQKETREKEQLVKALQQNQKLQAVGTLAAGIAHDFNNLLAVILAHGEFLKKQLNEESQQYALDKILSMTDKASSLTRQLLTFARKETQRKELLSINEVIQHAIEIVEPSISKSVQINSNLDLKLPNLNADRNQLTQMLINLALNANDAMEGSGQLSIESSILHVNSADQHLPALEMGRYICLKITDTGCGIAEPDQEHIFDPFYTTKEVGKGTGLGLSSVYGIMQQHNGHIEVESTLGTGTSFLFFFPLD